MKALLAAAVVVLAVTAAAGAKTTPFPDVIALPNGLQPEGIEIGKGTTFYAGSRATGAVVRGDLRTGVVGPLVPAASGRFALGIEYDHGLLFVAGGEERTGLRLRREVGGHRRQPGAHDCFPRSSTTSS